jgi:hypothetical protein
MDIEKGQNSMSNAVARFSSQNIHGYMIAMPCRCRGEGEQEALVHPALRAKGIILKFRQVVHPCKQ